MIPKGYFIESQNKVFKFTLKANRDLDLACHDKPIWSLHNNNNNNIKHMVFEDNGGLLLYQNDDSVVWSTETQARHAET